MAHRFIGWLTVFSMIAALLLAFTGSSAVSSASHPATPQQTTFSAYLSTVSRTWPPAPSIFGVVVNRNTALQAAQHLPKTTVSWVRYDAISWAEVEATQGTRDWSQLSGAQTELAALSQYGATTAVIVQGWPAWARKVATHSCGPIKEEALDAFAAFMSELVARYSLPPYNVKYWELGNEPDIDPRLATADSQFGCWGNMDDPYYGGGYYAQMLKRVYPAIKRVDPQAKIILGGLLLNCDPNNPPATAADGCLSSKFLEGILREGGGDFFDILAFHGYPLWNGGIKDWDLEYPTWRTAGGVVLGKTAFLRSIMQNYNVTKPIILNEGGLLCYEEHASCTDEFFAMQANYVIRLYTRAWVNGIYAVQWYTLNGPGWWKGGLLDGSQTPRPAFTALTFFSRLLYGAQFLRTLSTGSFEGYEFRNNGKIYQIYWTNASNTTEIGVPPGTQKVYSKLGQELSYGSTLMIGYEPIIIESAP